MLDAELVKKRLRFEIGDPQVYGFAIPDRPEIKDLDDVVRAGHAHIDDRRDPIGFGGDTDVTEAREVEDLGQIGQNVVRKKGPPLCGPPHGR